FAVPRVSLETSLLEVQRVLASLEPLPEFVRRDGVCEVCGRPTRVLTVAVLGGQGGDDEASIVTSIRRYRGWRVDLLSYSTSAGWRPFVLIRGIGGTTRLSNMPTVLPDVHASKSDADAAGLRTAQPWIDAHVHDLRPEPSDASLEADSNTIL